MFYVAQYSAVGPLIMLATSTPGRPLHSDTNSASPGSILAMQQLGVKTFTHISARYSFIQLSEQGCRGENELRNIIEGGGFEPGISRL